MISKKLKNKVLSILLTAAVAVTSVPSVPIMAAMPENEEEVVTAPEEDVETPQEDAETPQVEEDVEQDEQIPQAEEASQSIEGEVDFAGAVNVDVKAVGSNGVQYSDVAYLSVNAYNGLSEEYQELYTEMCDTVAEWKVNGEDYKDIVIYIKENGNLGMQVIVPLSNLYTSDEEFSVFEGITTEGSDESADTKEDTEGSTESEDENIDNENNQVVDDTDKEDGEENDSNTSGENQEGNAADDSEQPADPDDNSNDADNEEPDNNTDLDNDADDSKSESKESEEKVFAEEEIGEAEESSNIEENVEKVTRVISENTELTIGDDRILSYNVDIPIDRLNTKLTDENYYKAQIDEFAKKLYEIGKQTYVDDKYQDEDTTHKPGLAPCYTASGNIIVSENTFIIAAMNSLSALINMYPNSFNWVDLGFYAGLVTDVEITGVNTRSYTVGMAKSQWYDKSMETKADQVVNGLRDKAVQYATTNYPVNPTYGIIEYFDEWICENNYYNYVGTSNKPEELVSDVYYYCHSAYGILFNGYGVCESYALAMSRLLDAAGIRNQYVVGNAGGGHAWNYVQMPDNQWYLLDSTWNDIGDYSSQDYLLVRDDGVHKPTGKRFKGGKTFKFEKRSNKSFSAVKGAKIVLAPKGKYNMSVEDSYYRNMVTGWESDTPDIVAVNQSGQLTAGKDLGKARIKMTLKSGGPCYIDAYVCNYKVSGLAFPETNKSSYTYTYTAPAAYFDNLEENPNPDILEIAIKVNQTGKVLSAEELQKAAALSLSATSGNKKVAIVGTPTVKGDYINLRILPLAIGKSKITVKLGNKSASYTLNVKYSLDESWFDFTQINSNGYDYTGKAIKPKVTKKSDAPKAVKFKVTYEKNKNAGTAIVKVTGTGNYSGEIKKTFVIRPSDQFTGDVQFLSCTESVLYNGAGQEPKTKVKVGNKTLKQGNDYDLVYKKDGKVVDKPKEAGTYTVSIKINNYSLTAPAETKEFTIKKTTLDKVKVTSSSSAKYTAFDLLPELKESIKVKIGKNFLEEGTDYKVTFTNSKGEEVTKIIAKDTYKVVIEPTVAADNVTAGKKTKIEKTIKVK